MFAQLPLLTRRAALLGLGAAAALPAWPGLIGTAAAAPLPELVLYGPPAGPSITLAQAVASGGLDGLADHAATAVWRNPDEMRAGLTSGSMQAVVLPVQVAANLYNKGMKLKLLNIMTDGLLYILSADAGLDSLAALKGKTLAVPFRNDMPDLVLARLLATEGLVPGTDLTVQNTGTPVEAMQMLLTGHVDAVLAPEPAGSAAIIMGKAAGKEIHRVIDIQKLWGEVTGASPVLPQAGMAIMDSLSDEFPDAAGTLQAALAAAATAVNADPDAAAALAAKALDFPAPVLAASIPVSKLVATPATQARAPIEAMLETLAEHDPAIIGGKLPDDGFYL